MADTIDDITIAYEENGVLVVEELDKAVLTRGAWTTIMFRYRQWEPAKADFGPERYSIRRYRKMSGEFRPQSKFNISSRDQAKQMVEILTRWLDESGEG